MQTQPFASTFGRQATRKRPKLSADSYADMLQMVRHLPDLSMLLSHLPRLSACPPARLPAACLLVCLRA